MVILTPGLPALAQALYQKAPGRVTTVVTNDVKGMTGPGKGWSTPWCTTSWSGVLPDLPLPDLPLLPQKVWLAQGKGGVLPDLPLPDLEYTLICTPWSGVHPDLPLPDLHSLIWSTSWSATPWCATPASKGMTGPGKAWSTPWSGVHPDLQSLICHSCLKRYDWPRERVEYSLICHSLIWSTPWSGVHPDLQSLICHSCLKRYGWTRERVGYSLICHSLIWSTPWSATPASKALPLDQRGCGFTWWNHLHLLTIEASCTNVGGLGFKYQLSPTFDLENWHSGEYPCIMWSVLGTVPVYCAVIKTACLINSLSQCGSTDSCFSKSIPEVGLACFWDFKKPEKQTSLWQEVQVTADVCGVPLDPVKVWLNESVISSSASSWSSSSLPSPSLSSSPLSSLVQSSSTSSLSSTPLPLPSSSLSSLSSSSSSSSSSFSSSSSSSSSSSPSSSFSSSSSSSSFSSPLIPPSPLPPFSLLSSPSSCVFVSFYLFMIQPLCVYQVAQAAAHALGVPLDMVKVRPNQSLISNNAMLTGGSTTSEQCIFVSWQSMSSIGRDGGNGGGGLDDGWWSSDLTYYSINNAMLTGGEGEGGGAPPPVNSASLSVHSPCLALV